MRERWDRLQDYWTDDTNDGRRLRRLNYAFYAWMLGTPVPWVLLGNLIYPTLLIGAVVGAVVGVFAAAISASLIAEHFVERPRNVDELLARDAALLEIERVEVALLEIERVEVALLEIERVEVAQARAEAEAAWARAIRGGHGDAH